MKDCLIGGGPKRSIAFGVGELPDVGREEKVGVGLVNQIGMPNRPAGGRTHLAHRSPQRFLDRLSLVGGRCCVAQQLERGRASIDALEHPVVLLGDLADLGVRLHCYGRGVVLCLPLLVHVGEQIEDLGARPVLGHVEADPLTLGIDPEREPAVDQP